MNTKKLKPIPATLMCLLMGQTGTVTADALIQCPNDVIPGFPGSIANATMDAEDLDVAPLGNFPGAEDTDHNGDGILQNFDNTSCIHVSGSDGYITMADGYVQYMFGFGELRDETAGPGVGFPEAQAQEEGLYNARMPSSRIVMEQDQALYLTLTNPGMLTRPDLFDSHTVHYHGFHNAAAVFDGVPELSIAINQNASLTYYYKQVEPGTYQYHCHVEATEHMQMGMMGHLFVHAGQDKTGYGSDPLTISNRYGNPSGPLGYVYNDGDGDTAYDVEVPLQIMSFDPAFHDASRFVQPLPFADMEDKYSMLNGRGYPDTVVLETLDLDDNVMKPGLPAPSEGELDALGNTKYLNAVYDANDNLIRHKVRSQTEHSLVTATAGQKILLRVVNMSITNSYTLTTLGLDFRIVGRGARIMRSNGQANGVDISVTTNTVDVGDGETMDLIIDTAGIAPGTYFLYTTNLNYLSNNLEDYGGLMTEIRIL